MIVLNVESLKTADIEWADLVFATAMLVQKDSLKQVVKRCKTRGKRVVLGGPYVTTTIEDLPDADHIFVGELLARILSSSRSGLNTGDLVFVYVISRRLLPNSSHKEAQKAQNQTEIVLCFLCLFVALKRLPNSLITCT